MRKDIISRTVRMFHVVYKTESGEQVEIVMPRKYKAYNMDTLKNCINHNKEYQPCKEVVNTYVQPEYYYMYVEDFLKVAQKGVMVDYGYSKVIKPLKDEEK